MSSLALSVERERERERDFAFCLSRVSKVWTDKRGAAKAVTNAVTNAVTPGLNLRGSLAWALSAARDVGPLYIYVYIYIYIYI